MLEATEYPAEIADFYSAISAGYWVCFLVAKIVTRYLIKKVSSPIPSAPTGKIYARFYATQHASLQLSRKIPSMDDRIRTFLIVPLL